MKRSRNPHKRGTWRHKLWEAADGISTKNKDVSQLGNQLMALGCLLPMMFGAFLVLKVLLGW